MQRKFSHSIWLIDADFPWRPLPAAFPDSAETSGDPTDMGAFLQGVFSRSSRGPALLTVPSYVECLIREMGAFRRAATAAAEAAAEVTAAAEEVLAAAKGAAAPDAVDAAASPPDAAAADAAASPPAAGPCTACPRQAPDEGICDCGPRSGLYCGNPLEHCPFPRLPPDFVRYSPLCGSPGSEVPTSDWGEVEFPIVAASVEYSVEARIKRKQRRKARAAALSSTPVQRAMSLTPGPSSTHALRALSSSPARRAFSSNPARRGPSSSPAQRGLSSGGAQCRTSSPAV